MFASLKDPETFLIHSISQSFHDPKCSCIRGCVCVYKKRKKSILRNPCATRNLKYLQFNVRLLGRIYLSIPV